MPKGEAASPRFKAASKGLLLRRDRERAGAKKNYKNNLAEEGGGQLEWKTCVTSSPEEIAEKNRLPRTDESVRGVGAASRGTMEIPSRWKEK